MSVSRNPEARPFLARWSARKRDARLGRADGAAEDASPLAGDVAGDRAAAPTPVPARGEASEAGDVRTATPLPDVDTLTFDSDFSPFMADGVDADVRRAAVRKLLRDPRFNVMDGLDVYIDDYSREDPIPPSMLAQLQHAAVALASRAPPAGDDRDAGTGEPAVHAGAAHEPAALEETMPHEVPATLPARDADAPPAGADGVAQTGAAGAGVVAQPGAAGARAATARET